jgi:4-hydroxy-2-oxoheptanedioate aldolase
MAEEQLVMDGELQDLMSDSYSTSCRHGLKAEFEAEGARFDDLVAYSNIAHATRTPLVIKIGGCEAVSDLFSARLLGAAKIVAPMVESSFALRKFVSAVTDVYGSDRASWPRLFFNIETERSARECEELLDTALEVGVDGVVVGRGDLAESMGLPRGNVDSPEVSALVREVLLTARARGLACGMGGGVSARTVETVLALSGENALDFFETRKVLIKVAAESTAESLRTEILVALKFELRWLEHKRALYARIVSEDDARIERLGSELERG